MPISDGFFALMDETFGFYTQLCNDFFAGIGNHVEENTIGEFLQEEIRPRLFDSEYCKSIEKTKKQLEQKLTDDQIRIRLLKTEVHYFKGLAIMITVLIFCVFIAFGVLFGAMYMETRITRVIFQEALKDILPAQFTSAFTPSESSEAFSWMSGNIDADDLEAELDEDILEIEDDWLSFAKYGVTTYFPNSWTYFDRPYVKQVHFFADGQIRPDDSEDVGDVIVTVTDSNNFADEESSLISIAGKIGFKYYVDSTAIVIPVSDQFVQIEFAENLESEIAKVFIRKFQLD